MPCIFKSKTGLEIAPIVPETYEKLWGLLQDEYKLDGLQLIESASYSLAMVVRYALGLSALEGKVAAVVSDCLSGWITLATLRHLQNSGADTVVLDCSEGDTRSQAFILLISQLDALKVPREPLDADFLLSIPKFLDTCHNMICGLYQGDKTLSPIIETLLTQLNEAPTPVHTVEAPPGLDMTTGEPFTKAALYASSTLSLGVPLQGLYAGRDYVGRHYICDISAPRTLHETLGIPSAPLFAEQPVVQIFPVVESTADSDDGSPSPTSS